MDWNLFVKIGGPVLGAIVGVLLDRWLERKPRVVAFFAYATAVYLSEQKTTVHTHSMVIRNAGRKTATNLRVGHQYLPDFSVYPSVDYKVETLPDGTKEMVFSQLVPEQQLTLSYLYFPPLLFSGVHTRISHDDGFAKVIRVLPTIQLSRMVRYVLLSFMGLGVITAFYLIIQGILWLFAVNLALTG